MAFKEELKALFEKYDVVFDISGNKIYLETNGGINSESVTLFFDEDSEVMDRAVDKMQ